MVKSAEITCFGTFCIIPIQMVKSAENTCFGQIWIFLCQNYMFWHFSDSFITLFSFLQIPMCIVLPSEQKTRSGTKYTGYVHKLIPEDEEKTSDFFKIILASMVLHIMFPAYLKHIETYNNHLQILNPVYKVLSMMLIL